MNEDELYALLEQMQRQQSRMPLSYQNDSFGISASSKPPAEANLPKEFLDLMQDAVRIRGSTETPFGNVGVSVGTETGKATPMLEYQNSLKALGGLLNYGGSLGDQSRSVFAGYSPSNVPMSISGSLSQNEFGQLMKSIQAQYATELAKNMMLGIYGQAGSNPMFGLRLQGRF